MAVHGKGRQMYDSQGLIWRNTQQYLLQSENHAVNL